VHQELLPSTDGGKRVAAEVVVATRAVRNVLRSGNELQLRSALQTGGMHGMIEMATSLGDLLAEGAITDEQYQRVLRNYQAFA
jgi:twitching motility protein PilT